MTRLLCALSICSLSLFAFACSGSDVDPQIDLFDTPGEADSDPEAEDDMDRVIIDPDDFDLQYRFECEPLNCQTECRLGGSGDWFDCDSPFSLDHNGLSFEDEDTADFFVQEGVLRFEVRAWEGESDKTSPDSHDLLVLYDFPFGLDDVGEYVPDSADSPYAFPGEFSATCDRDYGDYNPDDCELTCQWEAEDLDAPIDVDCPHDEPFDIEFPDESLDHAYLTMEACVDNFGGSQGQEYCQGPQTYLFFPDPLTWEQVSAGAEHACGLLEDDSLWCWGSNNAGQVGIGSSDPRIITATEVTSSVASGNWMAVAAGGDHTCALDDDGALYCWGESDQGQLGVDPDASDTPTLVDDGPWQDIVAGSAHTCAIDGDNEIYCWGDNARDQLGTGDGQSTSSPTLVERPADVTQWLEASAGDEHTCAIGLKNGNLRGYCWGNGRDGRLGNGLNSGTVPSPSEIDITSSLEFLSISAGEEHSCAVIDAETDIEAYCWGNGRDGRLGQSGSSNETPTTPIDVTDGTDYSSVIAGYEHSCGIDADDELHCWGNGSRGQLGTGENEGSDTPQPVAAPDDERFSTVTVGDEFACAIETEGRLYCWGEGSRGRLASGDEDEAGLSTPQRIEWPQGRLVPTIEPGE